jgi:2-hydroxychromene-2-carboxylate isomerase
MTENSSSAHLIEIKHLDELANILKERSEWQRIMDLEAEKQLDVYLDLKSPHAYLAVRPSLEVARDYRVRINFLPFTLSYESYGLTTSIEPDMKRRPPSAAADRKARMYYTAAREYASLQRLPFRTPHRMLDSTLAHKAFLFAKTQNVEVPFIMQVYLHGWGSGWRTYELESNAQLQASLLDAGALLEGFDEYIATGGLAEVELERCMQAAVTTGYSGVPHYVLFDTAANRQLGLFGREHLALIRGKLHQEGLARHSNVSPEFSHAWRNPSKL